MQQKMRSCDTVNREISKGLGQGADLVNTLADAFREYVKDDVSRSKHWPDLDSIRTNLGVMVAFPAADPVPLPPVDEAIAKVTGGAVPVFWRDDCDNQKRFNAVFDKAINDILAARKAAGNMYAAFQPEQWKVLQVFFEGKCGMTALYRQARADQDRQLKYHLTMQQRALSDRARYNLQYVAVPGYAGTGKSLCLLYRAEQLLLNENNRVLIILPSRQSKDCFLDAHRAQLASLPADRWKVMNWQEEVSLLLDAEDGTCTQERKDLGLHQHILFDEVQLVGNKPEKLAQLLMKLKALQAEARAPTGSSGSGGESGSMWLFYDDNQLHSRVSFNLNKFLEKLEFKIHGLTYVVRNSRRIAEFATRLYVGWQTDAPVPVDGLNLAKVQYELLGQDSKSEVQRYTVAIQKCLKALFDEGWVAGDIAVLDAPNIYYSSDEFKQRMELLRTAVRSVRDPRTDQPLRCVLAKTASDTNAVVVDTAMSFQGRERHAVIVCDATVHVNNGGRLYVAFSRAISRLLIICTKDERTALSGKAEDLQRAAFPPEKFLAIGRGGGRDWERDELRRANKKKTMKWKLL